MKPWLRRARGAIGMGMTWAVAWGLGGVLVTLGFLVRTGSRPDAPFPIMFSVAGFIAGLLFSGILGLVEGRRRFDEMSPRRFAAWGAAGGFVLATGFVVAVSLAGDGGFLWNLVFLGPVFAIAGAGSAAGSLALARRAQNRGLLEATDDVRAMSLSDRESQSGLRNRQ